MRCRLELLAVIVACGIGLAGMPLGAAQPPDPLGAIMPYSLLSCGGEPTAIADRLRFVKRESGLSRFVLYGPTHIVRVVGMRTVADYAEMGRKIGMIKNLVAADGIEVGYLMMPTMNCGIRHPFRGYVYRDGRPRDITACPADSAFRADFAAKCAALAREARPAVFMMEDDFHYFGEGCFCDFHRKRFEGMDKDDRHKSLIEDLRLIAEATERAVHAVSPETRIGLCAPRFIPVADTELLAFAFAGPKRPLVRYYGSWYGNDYPIAYAGVLIAAQRAIETLSPKVEYVYESDPVPHSRFYASAARIGMLCSWASAMGYSAPYYWGLGAGEDALRTKDYLHLYARDSSRWAAVRDEAVKGDSVGVRTDGAWYWTMNRLGIPVTLHEAPVELYAGANAFDALADSEVTNLLARAVLLDGAAAEALTARGFPSLIGVSATRRESVDFTGESTADGKVRFPCSFHQDFGLDGTPVSRLVPCGAEEVAFMFAGTPTNRVQPSVTCFENRLGGRVGVMATNVGNCQSPNVYSFAKRDCLVRLIARLGGRPLPARVIDRANVALLANVDRGENRLFLHLSNLGCDPLDSVEFELDPRWRNGRVETLDGSVWRESDVRWQGTVVRIPAEAAVFGTLAVRVRKNKD